MSRRPVTIPLTNLKREWKFNWFLSSPTSDEIGDNRWEHLGKNVQKFATNISDTGKELKNTLSNAWKNRTGNLWEDGKRTAAELKAIQILSDPVLNTYVSQLAKSVSLPDDEIEFDKVLIGNVEVPVAKSYKINPITVTYYDDNLDTVYNFHKNWINLARSKDKESETGPHGMTMNIVNGDVCLTAKYVVYEDSLGMAEYALLLKWLNKGMSFLTSATEKVTAFFNLPDLSDVGEVVDPFLKWHSTQTFPYIFPQRVQRSGVDKSGEGLSKVTVTYERIPKFVQRPTAYTYIGKNDPETRFGLT